MGKIAFVFSGQGAQKAGMGKDFYENNASVKELFARRRKSAPALCSSALKVQPKN